MKKLIFLSLFLVGCVHQPIADPSHAGQQNGCLPDAIEMVQGLHGAGIQAEVVRMTFEDASMGHAIAAYIYPPGSNKLYVWDKANGSFRIHAIFADPVAIANGYAFWTASPNITTAEFIQ